MENYYERFNIDQGASKEEIKECLLNEHKKWLSRSNSANINHQAKAESMMHIIMEAESILTDDDKRKKYDAELADYILSSSEPEVDEDPQENMVNDYEWIDHIAELIDNGQFAEAIVEAKRVVELDPNSDMAWGLLGAAYYNWGELDKAIHATNKAIDLSPDIGFYYENLCHIYFENPLGDWDKSLSIAAEAIRKALILSPEDTSFLLTKAALYYANLEYDNAIETLERLREKETENEIIQRALTKNYYQKALTFLYKPNNEDDMHYCVDKRKTEDALAYFKKARKIADETDFKDIDEWIDVCNRALTKHLDIVRFIKWVIAPVILLLIGLSDGSFGLTVISALFGFLAYKLNHRYGYEITKQALKS